MLNLSRDIRSLSEFKRNTPGFMKQLRSTGHPVVLTINGKAELVVQTAEGYQELLDSVSHEENVKFIKASREQVNEGKVMPLRQVVENLGKKKKRN